VDVATAALELVLGTERERASGGAFSGHNSIVGTIRDMFKG
jgi:hypothetical protein